MTREEAKALPLKAQLAASVVEERAKKLRKEMEEDDITDMRPPRSKGGQRGAPIGYQAKTFTDKRAIEAKLQFAEMALRDYAASRCTLADLQDAIAELAEVRGP